MDLKESGSATVSWSEFASAFHNHPLVERTPAVIFFGGPANEELLFRLCLRTWKRKITLFSINHPDEAMPRMQRLLDENLAPELIVLDFSNEDSIRVLTNIRAQADLQNTPVIILVSSKDDFKRTSSLEKMRNYQIESRPDDYLELKETIHRLEDLI